MKTKRFSGLELSAADRAELERIQRSRKPLKVRMWRRVRVLLLLDDGHTVRGTAIAVGGYPREISRVAKRYLQAGLQHALSEDARPKPEHKLDSSQEAAVVALVCGPPPDGQSRWSLRLIAEEVSRRGIVDSIGRETVRVMLARRDLKPWREKMWCVPEIDQEFVGRMEDVLRLHARRYRASEPVVCLDERPVQLLEPARSGTAMKPGRVRRSDYEYVRAGTANVFCIVEPKTGRRLTYASANRTGRAFAHALYRIARRYSVAEKIHLVVDNLNTHAKKSLTDALGSVAGHKLWRRFKAHYTPKHASWLNPAEIEASLVSRECFGVRRIGHLHTLKSQVAAWRVQADRARRPIRWTFTVRDARRVFRYDGIVTRRSEY